MKNITKKTKKGFTLIEMIISVAIFSIIMTAIVVTFSSYIKTNRYSRIVQRNLESVQFAFNYMAKTLRVSNIIEGEGDDENIFTYSKAQTCTYFYLKDEALWYKTVKLADVPPTVPGGTKEGDKCGKKAAYTGVSAIKLTTGNVKNLKFDYTYTSRGDESATPPIPPTVGRATFSAAIEDKTTSTGLIWAQTSVSSLNYPGEISF